MSEEPQDNNQLTEPSVLDYVKSLFRFGSGERIRIPDFVEEKQEQTTLPSSNGGQTDEAFLYRPNEPSEFQRVEPAVVEAVVGVQEQPAIQEKSPPRLTPFPWRSLLSLLLALIGQSTFEPPAGSAPLGVAFYIAALSMLGWAVYRGEWALAPHAQTSERTDPLTYRFIPLSVSAVLGLWAFVILGKNFFTRANVIVWGLAIVFFVWALWVNQGNGTSVFSKIATFLKRDSWTINISRWTLLLLAATVVIFFFRFYQTTGVPSEPFSDHAEKILDVYEVSQGQTHIFFIRNTGREAFQMYWTVLVAKLFGTGFSFLSLKLGTAILGFLTLPFVYLLGKEIGGPRVGLFALLLVGIGYWPNVISRVGLRFPLYPLFVAPTLFFLLRGLRTRNRNDFLLSGLFLGIGLHGYSPFRIVPFVVVAAFLLYWLHSQSKGARRELFVWLAVVALTSLFVFLPLLRYWYDDPSMFGFRVITRVSGLEQPLPGPAYEIFFSNLWNALQMFNVNDGEIWVHSVPARPAMDIVSAALFLLGVVLLLIRYIRNRHWLDLFLLVSIPLLLMPSILSLAFPGENPALNRAGGAYIPAFLIGALALDGVLTSFGRGGMRTALVWILAGTLLYISANQNYDLVFNQYASQFRQASWNTSDMGRIVKEFEQTYGRTDTVWIVPFEHWVDTRLPAVWAGIPNRDMAVWPENIPGTVELTGPKLFMVKAELENPDLNDQASLDILQELYPNGNLRMFDSDVPGHDFWIFTVPN